MSNGIQNTTGTQYNEAVEGKTKLKNSSFSIDLHLGFFKSIASGTAPRESFASSQIN